MTTSPNKIAIFKNKKIRRTIHNDEWWFVVVDVIEALTDSVNPSQYLQNMLNRDQELAKGWVQIEHPLLVETSGGPQKIRCANAEGIFRIVQSITSPKAEPFKRWLAKVGYERVQEIEDPELAQKRTRMIYKIKGYPEKWIELRMRGIVIRDELTDEWKNRGAQEDQDYEILTSEISKATFGVTPSEYKKLKNLKRENLRDHMDDFELLLTSLGERTTAEIHRTQNSRGVPKLKRDTKVGGKIAGNTRKQIEKRIKRSIVTKQNYLKQLT